MNGSPIGSDDPAPQRPPVADPRDCCGNGCANCVLDRHAAALESFEVELAAWQSRQLSRFAPAQDLGK